MQIKNYYTMKKHQYKITVNFNGNSDAITLAGFCADEQSEATMSRHLFNVCKQSNRQFTTTQHLITNVVLQWQNCFNVSATQMLQTATHIHQQTINKISLYKLQDAGVEKLLNTFQL
jgi:hypothetical protein